MSSDIFNVFHYNKLMFGRLKVANKSPINQGVAGACECKAFYCHYYKVIANGSGACVALSIARVVKSIFCGQWSPVLVVAPPSRVVVVLVVCVAG